MEWKSENEICEHSTTNSCSCHFPFDHNRSFLTLSIFYAPCCTGHYLKHKNYFEHKRKKELGHKIAQPLHFKYSQKKKLSSQRLYIYNWKHSSCVSVSINSINRCYLIHTSGIKSDDSCSNLVPCLIFSVFCLI